ncbi:MAG: hypothetical protein ACI4WH_08490 [Oscillospiraceae bacterium]
MKSNKSNVRRKSKKGLKRKKKSKGKLKISKRGLLTIVVFILVLLLLLVILTNSYLNKNSLDRISSKLESNLNKSISEVEKNTKIQFYTSASSDLLCNLQSFDYVTEPSSTVEVLGTNLPKWIVYVKTNKSGSTTQYTIYDFDMLSNNLLGCEHSAHITTDAFVGLSEDSVTSSIGFKPYVRKFMLDGSKLLIFRYNYQEDKSKSSNCIQLTFNFDADDKVTTVTETSINYVANFLSIIENDSTKNNSLEIGTS